VERCGFFRGNFYAGAAFGRLSFLGAAFVGEADTLRFVSGSSQKLSSTGERLLHPSRVLIYEHWWGEGFSQKSWPLNCIVLP
jgi:hypothetical protein